jgi:hypothetical protein
MGDNTLMIKEYKPLKLVHGKTTEKAVTFYYPLNSSSDEFRKLTIQTPRMYIPFDLEERKMGDKVFIKNINLSLREIGSDKNKKRLLQFEDKIKETDKRILDLLPEKLLMKNFYPSLYQGKNLNYKPNMKVSIPFDGDDCKISIYNEQHEQISDEKLDKGIILSAIIRLDKVWIWNDKMGVNWVVEQIKIYNSQNTISPKKNPKSFKLREDSD